LKEHDLTLDEFKKMPAWMNAPKELTEALNPATLCDRS